MEEESESFNAEIRALYQKSGMTYGEIARTADVSINSVYTCQMNKDMKISTYLKQLNCYLENSHYRFDYIPLNRMVPECIRHGKNLVIVEVSDEELKAYGGKSAVVMEKRRI